MSEEIGPKSSQVPVSEDGMAACDGVTSKRTLDTWLDRELGIPTAFFIATMGICRCAVVVLVSIIPQDGSTA